jgi:CheY-like chemotaxis protein
MRPLAGKILVVLNSSFETLDIVKAWFEAEGMVVHTATVSQFRTGGADLAGFIATTAPDVIVYDVALPYVANWRFLQNLRDDGPLKGRSVIVTTPNEQVLSSVSHLLNGEVTHEIIGKPADMQQLTVKVTQLIAVGV